MGDVQTRVLLDSNGQDLAVEHIQDVEPILEWNKTLRSEEQKSDWGRHVAEIPNVILVRWLNEECARGNNTMKFGDKEFNLMVAKKLKDPDWAHLRTDKPALITGWT